MENAVKLRTHPASATGNKRAATEAMDEKQARQRLLEGGYFVALGVPPGVEFGIDLKSYEVPGEV